MITAKVTSAILAILRAPASFMSVCSAAGPVTYALTPGGGGVSATALRTAATESLDLGCADVPGQVQLNVNGFAVGTLGSRLRKGIAPEVLDMRDVRGVGSQLLDEGVVVVVRISAERLLAFQHDHCEAVRFGFPEDPAHLCHRLYRRRIRCAHRHRPHLGYRLQRRYENARQDD